MIANQFPSFIDTLGNDAAIAFLEKLREKVKNENEARILCNTSIGTIHLSEKKFDETKVFEEIIYLRK